MVEERREEKRLRGGGRRLRRECTGEMGAHADMHALPLPIFSSTPAPPCHQVMSRTLSEWTDGRRCWLMKASTRWRTHWTRA